MLILASGIPQGDGQKCPSASQCQFHSILDFYFKMFVNVNFVVAVYLTEKRTN